MSLTVMLVTLLAALLHASWNFWVKSAHDKHLGMSAMAIGHLPFGLLAILFAPMPRVESWPYIITGSLLHVGYQIFLLFAYRIGDLSQVYPLARGVAPMLVAVFSVMFLSAALSWFEIGAVTLIGLGIMSLALVRHGDGMRNWHAAALSMVTGAFIATYSLVDGLGARMAGTALGFYSCLTIINAVLFALVMRFLRPGIITRLVGRHWQLGLQIGGTSFCAYALVIWAFTQEHIALVTALRETSIIIALFLGIAFLKERLDLLKVCATVITLLGVVLLRMSR